MKCSIENRSLFRNIRFSACLLQKQNNIAYTLNRKYRMSRNCWKNIDRSYRNIAYRNWQYESIRADRKG